MKSELITQDRGDGLDEQTRGGTVTTTDLLSIEISSPTKEHFIFIRY
jgi:hypothetical protein